MKKCPVIFRRVHKTTRGKYDTGLLLVCEDPSLLKPGELTVMYRDYIEEAVRQQPDMYVWSHKRFKHAWSEKYRYNWIDIHPVKSSVQ